jgi:hypothetical protein
VAPCGTVTFGLPKGPSEFRGGPIICGGRTIHVRHLRPSSGVHTSGIRGARSVITARHHLSVTESGGLLPLDIGVSYARQTKPRATVQRLQLSHEIDGYRAQHVGPGRAIVCLPTMQQQGTALHRKCRDGGLASASETTAQLWNSCSLGGIEAADREPRAAAFLSHSRDMAPTLTTRAVNVVIVACHNLKEGH